eukprot:scaffold61147_cov43-Tisochrysis_lutea.AAC.2
MSADPHETVAMDRALLLLAKVHVPCPARTHMPAAAVWRLGVDGMVTLVALMPAVSSTLFKVPSSVLS